MKNCNIQNQLQDLPEDIERPICLTEKEAAEYIGMSVAYLRMDRVNGYRENRTPGPDYLKLGRCIRYLKDDLDKWIQINRICRYP